MFKQLPEVESRFNTLKERAGKLAAFESSGLKQTLDSFQKTLNASKGVTQTNPTVITLKRALDSGIAQVESWIKAEEKEQVTSNQGIKTLQEKLSRTKQLLKVKRAAPQASEVELKYSNDAIEKSRVEPDTAASLSEFTANTLKSSYGVTTDIQNEADLTLLKSQLGALQVTLLQASLSLKETTESAVKNSNRLKNLEREISRLTPGTQAMEAAMLKLEDILDDIQPILEIIPESPQSPVNFDENGSFYGSAFLDAMKAGEGVTGFLKKAKETSDAHEVTVLKAENTGLKTQLQTAQTEIKTLSTKTTELDKSLSDEREAGTKLNATVIALQDSLTAEQKRTKALSTENAHLYGAVEANQNLAKEFSERMKELEADLEDLTRTKAADDETSEFFLRKQVQVLADNKRLQENLAVEYLHYQTRDEEAKSALDAKSQAEASAAFALKNLDATQTELAQTKQARHTAESDLALKAAASERGKEDLKRLNDDILTLATLAEKLQLERDEYQTESQYGYIRQKCDDLLRRRDELLRRVTTAEKAATQAGLETGYRESAHKTEVLNLKKEIIDLKDEIRGLRQELNTSKKTDLATENEMLKEKLKKAQDSNRVSTVVKELESSAIAGSLLLEKQNQALKAEVAQLKAESKAQLSVATQTTPSRLAEGIKKAALCAGFVLAAVATVAALGILGAAAVVYALPLLGIGLAIAAGGYVISKLVESRHQDKLALQALEPEKAEPVPQPRDALVVKPAIEKRIPVSAHSMLTV